MKCLLICFFATFPLSLSAQTLTEPDSGGFSEREKQLVEISRKIGEFYIFEDVAKELSRTLLADIENKTFENLSNQEFADALSTHLAKNGNDRHFNVLYRPNFEENPANEKELSIIFDRINRQWNYGFENVRRLDGNIGYIEYTGFPDANESAKQTLAAAMNLVANTNALILDLRDNNGGSEKMVDLFLSYFFEKKTKLGETYTRYSNETKRSFTKSKVRGKRYLDKPIYILVGKKTISAAEALAYSLQQRNIATVFGEVTYGAANPVRAFSIDKKFHLFVPVSNTKSAFSNTNWEHTGVVPDVKVSAENALTKAHILAMEKLLETNTELELSPQEIRAKIERLKQE